MSEEKDSLHNVFCLNVPTRVLFTLITILTFINRAHHLVSARGMTYNLAATRLERDVVYSPLRVTVASPRLRFNHYINDRFFFSIFLFRRFFYRTIKLMMYCLASSSRRLLFQFRVPLVSKFHSSKFAYLRYLFFETPPKNLELILISKTGSIISQKRHRKNDIRNLVPNRRSFRRSRRDNRIVYHVLANSPDISVSQFVKIFRTEFHLEKCTYWTSRVYRNNKKVFL